MITDIFHIILWATVVLLVISGIDDLFMDIMFWIYRRKYKKTIPSFSEMVSKPEKSIAIMIGAWNEDKVIGRTLTIALKKMRYQNYRFFLAVYPNDLKTVKVVREIARKDQRVVLCLNPQDGPTTKADNLNNAFTCVKEYEKQFGEFDIILIHDAEDFIHPLSLKLFNYLIMYKGNYGVQIPVIPIKSRLGKMFHRTMCDAFAELHTKDMVVRQSIGSYIPFAGTGMAFNRKAFHYLESQSIETEKRIDEQRKTKGVKSSVPDNSVVKYYSNDEQEEISKLNEEFETEKADPYPQYEDIPIPGFDDEEKKKTDRKQPVSKMQVSVIALFMVFLGSMVVMFANDNDSAGPDAHENTVAKTTSNTNNVQRQQVTKPSGNVINSNINNTNTTIPGTTNPANTQNTSVPDPNVKTIAAPNTNSEFMTFDANSIAKRTPNSDLNVIIEEYKDGTVKIQESALSSLDQAKYRANIVRNHAKSNKVLIYQANNIYKVVIGDFSTVDEAKEMAQKLRKSI